MPISRGPQEPPARLASARLAPIAKAIVASPATRKAAIWIQPSGPLLSRLASSWAMLNPRLVSPWISTAVSKTAPATTP